MLSCVCTVDSESGHFYEEAYYEPWNIIMCLVRKLSQLKCLACEPLLPPPSLLLSPATCMSTEPSTQMNSIASKPFNGMMMLGPFFRRRRLLMN
jgi:hypothetical protein